MSELIRLVNTNDGPISHLVTDNTLLQSITSDILGFWPNRKNNHFPAPLPVSLEKKDFYKLQQYPYVICVKSDGMRFLMMCYNGNTYMIDRAFRVYKINQNFNNIIYGSSVKETCGALFDGELVKTKDGKWLYIVHDCICMSGKDISQENFDDRYEAVTFAISDFWTSKGSDFTVSVKKFYRFDEVDTLKSELENNTINHNIDGLIFTPMKLPIGTQTQYTLFKWKPMKYHTFDFKIEENQRTWDALVSKGQVIILFASVEKNTPEGNKFTQMLSKNCPNFKNSDIVECSFNEETMCYEPLMIRTDKHHPNSLYTIEKTMFNIKENITMGDIFNLKK